MKPRRTRPWWSLLVLVLLVHAVALDWLGRQLQQSALLRPMPPPMFTRLLQPEAPVAPPAVAQLEAPQAATRPEISSITTRKPARKPKRAASAPVETAQATPAPQAEANPEAPAADPDPEGAQAKAAAGAASAPVEVAAASAPAPAASAPAAAEAQQAAAPAAPASSASAGLDAWPADTRLNYELGGLFRGQLHGKANVQWLRQDQHYETRIDINITLLTRLVVTSQGRVTPQGLRPEAYQELRSSGVRGARLRDDTIVLNDGRTVPRPPGVQDTASQFVDLSYRFASGLDPLEVGRSVSFWMARPGGVDLWTYDIVGRDVLQTPALGPIEAFHLKPRMIANPRGNITAEMWFAPSLQYLPVRIKVNMGDSAYVDLIVDQIEQR